MSHDSASDSQPLFAGIDGGGSTTRALIASPEGAVFGCGYAEGSNPTQLGGALARTHLRAAMSAAWQNAGIAPRPLSAVFCGIAGLRAYAAMNSVDTLWDSVFPGVANADVKWDHDLRTALAGGLRGQPGIVLVAGTGSACYARNAQGGTAQVGGWGALLDDAGSAYALGLTLLKHAIRAWEGRAPGSRLTQSVADEIQINTPSDALQWTKSFADPRPEIAQLAPLVLQAWRDGDPLATDWVEAGANELAQLVATAARRVFPEQAATAIFAGGLSQDSEYFEKVRATVARLVNVEMRHAELNATAGALLLALELRHASPSESLLEKLRNLSAPTRVDSP
jgi:N-acetylglucosamine kinase-like BadF-type ATPase